MKKQYKAVISDLDGTLLNASHALSERTIKAVRALEAKGILFIIATGRHFRDVLMIKEKLGVSPYLITANGATVCDQTGSIVYESEIPKGIVSAIVDLEVPPVVFKNLYQGEEWLMEHPSDIFDDYYDEGGFKYKLCDFKERIEIPTNKIFFTSKVPEALLPIHDAIVSAHGDALDVTFSLPQVLEVMAKGTNKGAALLNLIEGLDIDREECVAFGDGLNDLEMLSLVGNGNIMANGDHTLKAKLPGVSVIGSNAEDSVAGTLETLFEI